MSHKASGIEVDLLACSAMAVTFIAKPKLKRKGSHPHHTGQKKAIANLLIQHRQSIQNFASSTINDFHVLIF